MKKCIKCNEEKSLDQFNQRQSKCKSCQYELTKKHYKTNKETYAQQYKKFHNKCKDGFHYVYYIPEHHYVGVTNNVINRKYYHKSVHKRILDGIEIVHKTPCRKEALKVESKLHNIGYYG